MKAIFFNKHGGIDVLTYGDFPDPMAEPGWVKLRVLAAALNWLDIETRKGMPNVPVPLPMITGGDCVGEIVDLTKPVHGFRLGDRVLVDPFYIEQGQRKGEMLGETRLGALAEYVTVRPSQLMRIPSSISDMEAAALPVAYATAYRMAVTRGRILPDEKVLLLGAAGGVGTACVQLCKQAGAYLIAVASSSEKCERLRKLGADETINASEEDFAAVVRARHGTLMRGGGVQVVINFVGGETWAAGLKCVAHGGRVLVCGASAGTQPQTDLRYIWASEMMVIGSDGWHRSDLQAVVDMVEAGRLKPIIAGAFPLTEGIAAISLLETRRAVGKLVVIP